MLLKPAKHLKYLRFSCKFVRIPRPKDIFQVFLTSLTAYRTEVGAIDEGGRSLHTFCIRVLYAFANEVLLTSLSLSVGENGIVINSE